MVQEAVPIDISALPEVLELAEEVQRSGVARVLKRGDREIAVLAPVVPDDASSRRTRRRRTPEPVRDSILNIIGIWESDEPTDVAKYKHEYLAEAYETKPR
jgi:hypothetical protein